MSDMFEIQPDLPDSRVMFPLNAKESVSDIVKILEPLFLFQFFFLYKLNVILVVR